MDALESRQVYRNPWLRVREDTVRRADGSVGTYAVVESDDIVLIVPADGDRLHLVEQYRHPIAARCWEFPSGNVEVPLDAGPLEAAERELREETGLLSTEFSMLGTLNITPSTMTQRCSVVLATALIEGAHERDLEEQDMRSAWFTRDEVERMIREGVISDGKSVAAFALLIVAGH